MYMKYLLSSLLFIVSLNFVSGKTPVYYSLNSDSGLNEPKFSVSERLTINIGYYLSNNSTGIILGSKALGLGLVIDMEKFLSLETNTSAIRGNVNYTFGKKRRSNVFFDYYRINRKATKILEAELEILDNTYPVGTQMDSEFNLSIMRAKYEYSFLLDDRVSMGVSAGLFIMPIKFSFQTTNYYGQSTSMIAPFPIVGLRAKVGITPKLYLNQSAELLYLKFNDFTGSFLDLNIALEYKMFKNFGAGVGLNSSRIKIAAQGNDYPNLDFYGDIKMEYMGILFYLSYFL